MLGCFYITIITTTTTVVNIGGEKMANQDIRQLLKDHRIYLWEVAQLYGCTESTLSKKLRIELCTKDKVKIKTIIEKLKNRSS